MGQIHCTLRAIRKGGTPTALDFFELAMASPALCFALSLRKICQV